MMGLNRRCAVFQWSHRPYHQDLPRTPNLPLGRVVDSPGHSSAGRAFLFCDIIKQVLYWTPTDFVHRMDTDSQNYRSALEISSMCLNKIQVVVLDVFDLNIVSDLEIRI
jgi:hypothetical protein